MHKTYLRVARVVVVVGLAVAGYLVFIPASHYDEKLLEHLLIRHSSAPGVPSKASLSEPVPASKSTFKAVKRAAKADPDSTGIYEVAWYVTSSAPPEAGLLLQLLPDTSSARLTFADTNKELGQVPSFSGETASGRTRFSVPSVAGSKGVSYALTDTTTKKVVGYTYSADFRVGRAVVSELMELNESKRSTAPVVKDVRAEDALVSRLEPGFSLSPTSAPVVASIVFAVVALAVAAGAFFLPEWIADTPRRRRERREAKERERLQSEYRARGRRAVRRHRAPAWRQGARR